MLCHVFWSQVEYKIVCFIIIIIIILLIIIITVYDCYEITHSSCPSQNRSEYSKNISGYTFVFTYVNIYENVSFLYYRKGNGQNYLKSLFLNAFINVEISFFYKLALNIHYS